jgi:hypothetical protein
MVRSRSVPPAGQRIRWNMGENAQILDLSESQAASLRGESA